MPNQAPEMIRINCNCFHTPHIGKLFDGRQFFLTTPFVPVNQYEPGSEFIALYIFNDKGDLISAQIDNLGPRMSLNKINWKQARKERLKSLGAVKYCSIDVKPFTIHQYDIEFGLIPRPPETEDGEWVVEAQPGNYLAFFQPWDSGEYAT